MKKKKWLLSVLCIVLIGSMFSGCSAPADEPVDEPKDEAEENEQASVNEEEEKLAFTEFSNLILLFGDDEKGMTRMFINHDGTFSGRYTLFVGGKPGDEHPDGIQYINSFTGILSEPVKKAEGVYSTTINQIDLYKDVADEFDVAGVLYRSCEPYGLAQGDEILIYPPKTPIIELPETYQTWGNANFEFPKNELTLYGFYHEKEGRGFFVHEKNSFDLEIEALHEKENELSIETIRGELTQADMNRASGKIYTIWDDELNKIWGELERRMTEKRMELLREEELRWINFRDAAAKISGKRAEGGSMQIGLEMQEATWLTKNRIVDLLLFLYEIDRKDNFRKPATYRKP